MDFGSSLCYQIFYSSYPLAPTPKFGQVILSNHKFGKKSCNFVFIEYVEWNIYLSIFWKARKGKEIIISILFLRHSRDPVTDFIGIPSVYQVNTNNDVNNNSITYIFFFFLVTRKYIF